MFNVKTQCEILILILCGLTSFVLTMLVYPEQMRLLTEFTIVLTSALVLFHKEMMDIFGIQLVEDITKLSTLRQWLLTALVLTAYLSLSKSIHSLRRPLVLGLECRYTPSTGSYKKRVHHANDVSIIYRVKTQCTRTLFLLFGLRIQLCHLSPEPKNSFASLPYR